MPRPSTPDEFFAGSELGIATYRWVAHVLHKAGIDFTVSTSKSQVAFRRRRGFAYLWLPGQYLRRPDAEVVLSIALATEVPSSRFKEVAHPAAGVWMHHLEIHAVSDLDDEVAGWLRHAAVAAGAVRR
jgi:hypothetical protein